jgi:hypothetical protein
MSTQRGGKALAFRAALALACAVSLAAQAEEPDLKQRVDQLERELQIRDRVIRNLLDRVNTLEDREQQQKQRVSPETAPAAPAEQPPGAPAAGAAAERPAPQTSLSQLRASAAFERRLIQQGGLLLPPNTFELEPAISYAHSSSDHVVIDGFTVAQVLVIGDIFNERIDRDIYQLSLTARWGLPGDSQFEVRIPYSRVTESVYNAQNQESSSATTALGDVELAYSHQFQRGSDADASLLGSLRWKTSTGQDPFKADQHAATFGTGYNSLQASLTAILTSDPAVFYGALSYTANLPVNEAFGRVDPGDSYGFQAGIALSLNMDTSLSIGWDQRYTRRTQVSGMDIPGSYLSSGSLAFGVSHTTFGGQTFDVRANIGLTRDTPDALISLALPFRL